MATTPFRAPGKDLEITDGNVITGADDDQGGDLVLEGGTSSSGNNDGADVVVRPGLPAGSGARGVVKVTNNGGTDLIPIMQLASESGGNAEDIRVFVGTQDPDTSVSGNPGDLYVTHNGTSSTLNVNTGSGDANTTWTDLSTASAAVLSGLVGVIWTDNQFYADAGDRNSYLGTGTSWTDLVASRVGTMTSVTVTNGHFVFDGASGDIDFSLDGDIENIFDGGGTLLAWVRPDDFGESSAGRVVGTADTGNTLGWFLGVGDASGSTFKPSFQQNFSTSDGTWRTTSTVSLGEWMMLAVTYNSSATGNDPTFYINGVADTTDEVNTPVGTRGSDTGNNLIVGNRAADDLTWDGAVDILMLFDRALSEAEIRQVYSVTGADRLRASLVSQGASDVSLDAQPIEILGGAGGTTSGTGGAITITGGAASAGTGGAVSISGGITTGGSAAGGAVSITGGASTGTSSDGGDVTITGGSKSTTGDGGNVVISGGSKTTDSTGTVGAVTIQTGADTGSAATSGGDLTLQVTARSSGSGTGDLILQGGDNTGSGAPGDIQILGGDASSNPGGPIVVTAGGGAGTGNAGGAITVTSGTAAAGRPGAITLQTPAPTQDTRGSGNINLTIGDTDVNYTSQPAGNINITGGSHTGSTGTAHASDINLTAGNHAGNESGASPGDITLTAGNQTGTSTTTAGSIYLNAGNKTAGNGDGGNVDLVAGDGNGNQSGGRVKLEAGPAGATGSGGVIDIDSGAGGATSGAGGAVTINTGSATSGAGGAVTITTGAGGTSGAGGAVTISTGAGAGATEGGDFNVQVGNAGATGAGGDIGLAAGSGGSTSGAGGDVDIDCGDATDGAGGALTASAGDGGTNGDGGDVTITAGTGAGSGTDGDILLVGPTGGTVTLTGETGRLRVPEDVEFASSGPRLISGSGTPESAVAAPVGSMYMRTDGGVGTALYMKESGTGNTGWATPAASLSEYHVVTDENGRGSTNDDVYRWTNVVSSSGTDISYTDSATDGGYWTINTTGIYSVSLWHEVTSGGIAGTAICTDTAINNTYTDARCRARDIVDAGRYSCISWVGPLTTGDDVWIHRTGTNSLNGSGRVTLVRLA